MKRKSVPSYLLHSNTGRGRAVWTDCSGSRHDKLLPGAFDSEESRKAFAQLHLTIETTPLRSGTTASDGITLAEVLLAYMTHADTHYRLPDGKHTSEIHECRIVVKAMREVYGEMPVSEFGPLAMKAIRQRWVNEARSRTECNRRLSKVKHILKWGVSEELVPAVVYQSVASVTGLQRGRTTARETNPVGPVEDATVDATLPFLNFTVRAMVEFERLTGCRPGEVCGMKRSEIDTNSEVWLYKPAHHKHTHRGTTRVIAVGPRAQEVLKPFFTVELDACLFPSGKRARYNRTSFARAIARACDKAFPPPLPLAQGEETAAKWWNRLTQEQQGELTRWQRDHRWHPNQLRHSYATKVRKQDGLEAAGAALGHSKMSTTQVYAERDAGLATSVALRIG